jgi:hypothetical protein
MSLSLSVISYLATYGAFFRSCKLCSHSRTSQHFMEPEGSLCLQEPSTGPYSEPDRSSPYHPILSKIHFNIVHSPVSWSSKWCLSFWLFSEIMAKTLIGLRVKRSLNLSYRNENWKNSTMCSKNFRDINFTKIRPAILDFQSYERTSCENLTRAPQPCGRN